MKSRNIILMIMVVALAIPGCGLNKAARVYDDENMLVEEFDSYNTSFSKEVIIGNRLSGSAKKLEGMGTIWQFDAEEKTEIRVTYRFNVSSGKAKLVLIAPDGTVKTIVECRPDTRMKQGVTEVMTVECGASRIKLVGAEETSVEYEFSVDKGELESFGE